MTEGSPAGPAGEAPTAGPATGYRCSGASRELGEPLEGTASTVRGFVLVEETGPWGTEAVRDCRMDAEVKQHLLALEREHRVRPLLVRRHGGRGAGGTRVFAAHVDPRGGWLETALLDDVRELLDVDLTGLARGRPPGLTPTSEPVFLVCTHGRHDACCAERGRPVSAAMTVAAPDHTWEVSHIGGDRFAGNALVLPDGLYYGRLEPHHAARFVDAHLHGRLYLEHLRGRSAYPFPVQAAEIYLRRHLGALAIAPLPVVSREREGPVTRVVLLVDGDGWAVRVHTERGPRRQLTCQALARSSGLVHRMIDITPA